jgi:hypothetical protein
MYKLLLISTLGDLECVIDSGVLSAYRHQSEIGTDGDSKDEIFAERMTDVWRVLFTEWLLESLETLPGTLEVQQVLSAIVRRLETAALNFPCLGETKIRLLKTNRHQVGDRIYPALRVFYFVDDDQVLVLWAEEYDEVDALSDEDRLGTLGPWN